MGKRKRDKKAEEAPKRGAMEEYEVECSICGAYFMLPTDSPELGDIDGVCPECGWEDTFLIIDERLD